jgi:predicted transcriptional regulator
MKVEFICQQDADNIKRQMPKSKKMEEYEGYWKRLPKELERKMTSLRNVAKELDVSHSYLSQVIHGKRPASEKVLTTLLTRGLIEKPFSAYNESTCQRSSVVEQWFRKPSAKSSTLFAGSSLELV